MANYGGPYPDSYLQMVPPPSLPKSRSSKFFDRCSSFATFWLGPKNDRTGERDLSTKIVVGGFQRALPLACADCLVHGGSAEWTSSLVHSRVAMAAVAAVFLAAKMSGRVQFYFQQRQQAVDRVQHIDDQAARYAQERLELQGPEHEVRREMFDAWSVRMQGEHREKERVPTAAHGIWFFGNFALRKALLAAAIYDMPAAAEWYARTKDVQLTFHRISGLANDAPFFTAVAAMVAGALVWRFGRWLVSKK